MINPVGDRAKREELRRLLSPYHSLTPNESEAALGGLDIAEEMAEALKNLGASHPATCEPLLRRWQAWKEPASNP